MTSRTAIRPTPRRTRIRAVIDSDLAAVVVASVVALSVGPLVLRQPVSVDAVSVTNSSDYDIGVQVSGDDHEGWMALETASNGSTATTVDVIDQGEIWIFRFTAQGRDGGELRVARSDLEQAGWTVTVPDETIQQLRDLGAPASP